MYMYLNSTAYPNLSVDTPWGIADVTMQKLHDFT